MMIMMIRIIRMIGSWCLWFNIISLVLIDAVTLPQPSWTSPWTNHLTQRIESTNRAWKILRQKSMNASLQKLPILFNAFNTKTPNDSLSLKKKKKIMILMSDTGTAMKLYISTDTELLRVHYIHLMFDCSGGGHRASANALADAFEELYPGKIESNIVDIW